MLTLAGMPSILLSDAAKVRLDTLSFFLVAFLLCALAIQRLWNWLRADFTRLPHLSYPKAVGLTTLWGLLFVLVLTMISGARELLTPGAWKKDGNLYKLDDQPPVDGPERTRRLEGLRAALWDYAAHHEGKLPPPGANDVPEQAWRVVDHPTAVRFVYVGSGPINVGRLPVAFEPAPFGARRYTLFTSGEIALQDVASLASGSH
jgi:hypothetical protein